MASDKKKIGKVTIKLDFDDAVLLMKYFDKKSNSSSSSSKKSNLKSKSLNTLFTKVSNKIHYSIFNKIARNKVKFNHNVFSNYLSLNEDLPVGFDKLNKGDFIDPKNT